MATTPTNLQERGLWTSASSAEADALCPGRHTLQKGMPDIRTESAETGNKVHAALCKGDPAGLDIDERELYDRCQKIEQDTLTRYFGLEIANLKAFPDREKRRWISWVQAGGLQHSGQADAVYRFKTKALIVDYKTGRNEVAVSPSNMQMRDLAVINWVSMPLLNEIGVAVIQPWVSATPEITAYKKSDIETSVKHMLARVQASNDPTAPRVAGELQCKYCRAKSKCPEYQKWAGSMVPVGDKSIVDIPCTNWTPAQCAIFLNNFSRAKKWLLDCEEAMKELVKLDANAIPGWALKEGSRREIVINAQVVFNRFSELGGSLEQFMDTITVGKTKLKTVLASVTKEKGKALEKSLEALTLDCVTVKEAEPTLKKVEVSI